MMKSIIFTLLFITLNADVDSFSKQLGTSGNLENGAISEHISTTIYKKNGYSQLNAEVGRNGIDGLFVKRDANGKLKEVVFSEVKHGKGKLGTIKGGTIKQMSKDWKIIKIDEKIKSLKKLKPLNENNQKLLKELNEIKLMIKKNSPKIKSQITKISNMGNNRYNVSFNQLNSDGSIGNQLKHKFNNSTIDLKKQYKVGSEKWKMQKTITHSVRKEKRLLKEKKELKKLLRKQKKYTKESKKYKEYVKKIEVKYKKIRMIQKSRPSKIFKSSSKVSKINMIYKKQGKKTLIFMKAKRFKKISKLKNMKFLKNIKGGDVVMMAVESGVAIYTVLHGGITYKKVSSLLLSNTKELVGQGFGKGIALITPPPATLVVIASIAGEVLVEYAIDKYIELEKRNYVGLEDMLWDVPDEIKNKVTILNLEDSKKETVFNFDEIDKESVFQEPNGKSVFEENSDDIKTILDD